VPFVLLCGASSANRVLLKTFEAKLRKLNLMTMSQGIVQGYRLSPQQKHLWLLQQHTPRSAFWSRCAVTIKGPLDPSRLERAIYKVVESHEILRTTFPLLPGMTVPVQVIHQEYDRCVKRSDISALNPEERTQSILSRAAADETSDYDSFPLFQCELLQVAPDETVMLLKAPAMCADLRSLEMIVTQIGTCYESDEGSTIESMQYADFAEWHHELIAGDEGERGRQYWNSRALRTDVKLPIENPVAEEAGFQPEVLRLDLSDEVARTGERLSLLALACWQVLIQRFNGSSSATIGKAVDGRRHSELANSVGLYNRYVPLPVDFIDEQLTIEQFLEKLVQAENEAAQWQEYFAWPEPDIGSKPKYFSVCFEERRSANTFRVADLSFSIHDAGATDDRFHVKLISVLSEAAPRLELHYDASRFASEHIRRLAEDLTTLIADAARNPGAPISDLQSLSTESRRRICKDFNQTTREFPSICIHELFEAQVKKTPNVTAVVCGSNAATYTELNERANQVARYLQRLGVGPDVPVGLCLERSVDFIVGMLGIMKAGGAYLPLDVNAPLARLATMLTEAGAPVLLTQTGHTVEIPGLRMLVMDDFASEFAAEDKTDQANKTALENLAYVIFTSGSTGKPKGVGVEHRQLCNYVHAIDDKVGLSASRNFAIVSTLVADLAHTMLFPSLLSGGTLHLIPDDHAANPEKLADYFSRNSIDCLKIVPTHLAALLTSSRAAEILPRRHLILGGEASSHSLLARIRELSSEVALWNHYGPTETTVGCAAQQIEREDFRSQPITVGTPLANNTIYILDQRMRPVSIGVPGELYVGGAGVARGYVNQPALTAERFVPDAFSETSGGRLYRTGDLARYSNDGRIEVLGRVDDQMKVRGYRIEPEEIQFALNEHTLVSQSIVVAREDRTGEKRLVAYVVAKQTVPSLTSELREFLGKRLPDYMVPSSFVFLEALPLTPNGKIDRRALPAPEVVETPYVAPRNSIEQELSRIWASVLGVPNPGINENFFELGGDSILAIQIIARANQAGMTLAPRQIFQCQTIAELAAVANDGVRPEAEQGIVTGEIPLTPVQVRFFELRLPEPHHYNQARLLTLREPVDSRALKQAVEYLLRHHDALRLRFLRSGKTWKQIASERESAVPFERIDVSRLHEKELVEVLASEAARLHASLNLEHGPIIRVALFDGADKVASYLLIVIHHLAVDTVSWAVLVEDLETAYGQLIAAEEISLPAKTTSFKRWAEELIAFAGSTTIEEEIDYWTSHLSRPVAKLPVDRSRANSVASRRTVSVSLTAAETRAVLQDLPTKHRTQINEVLLASITRSFTRWMGSSALLVDLEGHGREHLVEGTDLARTVGWFTSVFPVLLDIGKSSTSLAALRAVKEQLRAVPNRGIGYGILRYLSSNVEVVQQLSRLQQAEVRFNYLGQRDGFLGSSKMFKAVQDASRDAQSPAGERGYLLNIISSVTKGELRFDWTYSENIHARETIESLAENCVAELRALLADTETVYAPSDFPKAKISQNDLNTILAKLRT
jgi:amino acid adenylation domain-containing protein/non-ribosomal peptide synthase protein (TIGR01720 family)